VTSRQRPLFRIRRRVVKLNRPKCEKKTVVSPVSQVVCAKQSQESPESFSLVAGQRHNSGLQIALGTPPFLDNIPPQETEIPLREESVP